MTRTERAVHAGPADRRSLHLNSRSLRARARVRKTRGGYCTALRHKMPVFTTPNKRVMDPVPLNAVRAAAADGAAGTSGTGVAAPVPDIAGAAADIAADARAAALSDAAADVAVVAADATADTAAVAAVAADVAAAVDSAGDLYRRACRVRAIVVPTSPAPPAASGFEASGQGMVAVGPVRAPVKLLHANETTL